jgi:hypothetical protein
MGMRKKKLEHVLPTWKVVADQTYHLFYYLILDILLYLAFTFYFCMIRVLQKSGRVHYWTWVLKEANLELMEKKLRLLRRKMWRIHERIDGVMI